MSTGHTHTYNYELTGFDLTAGIFTGLALCAVLQSAVLYQNFKPWFKNPQLTPLPSPERFLGASIHSFIAMVITGAVLTYTFSRVDFDQNPIMDFGVIIMFASFLIHLLNLYFTNFLVLCSLSDCKICC